MNYVSYILFRKPDLVVDPENVRVREPQSSAGDDGNLDNRFSGTSGSAIPKKKCGVQAFQQRIVGGEICEIDEFPWAAMLLYESSKINFLQVSTIKNLRGFLFFRVD